MSSNLTDVQIYCLAMISMAGGTIQTEVFMNTMYNVIQDSEINYMDCNVVEDVEYLAEMGYIDIPTGWRSTPSTTTFITLRSE